MFSKMSTCTSTSSFSDKVAALASAIDEADVVVVGAGAGLSAAAGFSYTGERFKRYFSDFAAKYGFRDMYSGGFYPFDSPEETWAYWSRYIFINRYMDAPKPVYEHLLRLLDGKDYFVITTNVDHCFQKSGFDKLRLFYAGRLRAVSVQQTMQARNLRQRAGRASDARAAGRHANPERAGAHMPALRCPDGDESASRRHFRGRRRLASGR